MEPAGDDQAWRAWVSAHCRARRSHLRSTFYKAELAGISDPAELDGKAAILVDWEDRLCIMDTLIYCRFYRDLVQWPYITDVVNATIGTDYSVDDLRVVAGRIIAETHRFNELRGFGAENERLPAWITSGRRRPRRQRAVQSRRQMERCGATTRGARLTTRTRPPEPAASALATCAEAARCCAAPGRERRVW
jgi:aldehyde:ferredoxin oxidoreductase